jgi:hypothetical protein
MSTKETQGGTLAELKLAIESFNSHIHESTTKTCLDNIERLASMICSPTDKGKRKCDQQERETMIPSWRERTQVT